ncbi:MAG: DUF2804 domain-containing protein [Deltaproteobacteria bacterium]|nr:DUF2804 domain-containing protein [Deltaproteobacteria bacterium]
MIAIASSLPPPPSSLLDAQGHPAFGAYAGEISRVSWQGLRAPSPKGKLWTALHQKGWHFVSIAGQRHLAALAIIDLGWLASCFVYVFDRQEKRFLIDAQFMGPPVLASRVSDRAGALARSSFRMPGASFTLERASHSDSWHVSGHAQGLHLNAWLDAASAPPTLCAVAPIPGGAANCTHKTVCLPATGEIRVSGITIDLAGHTAMLDHTRGLLARETSWKWASLSAPGIGLNLVEGFNGPVENVVWIGGHLSPVGAATISHDPTRPGSPWLIRTDDGKVDLEFRPEGARRQDVNLVLASSRYVQPIGTFWGTIRGDGTTSAKVDGLVGVTEDHRSRW